MLSVITDEELVQRFTSTQESVYFDRLYQRYQPYVHRICGQYCRNAEDASDLTQDIFIRVLLRIDSYRGQARFKTWLNTISHNYCRDYVRRKALYNVYSSYTDGALLTYLDITDESAGLADEQNVWLLGQLEDALNGLHVIESQLLRYHYCQHVPIRELAMQHNLSESAVKMRLFRAREKVRVACRKPLA